MPLLLLKILNANIVSPVLNQDQIWKDETGMMCCCRQQRKAERHSSFTAWDIANIELIRRPHEAWKHKRIEDETETADIVLLHSIYSFFLTCV